MGRRGTASMLTPLPIKELGRCRCPVHNLSKLERGVLRGILPGWAMQAGTMGDSPVLHLRHRRQAMFRERIGSGKWFWKPCR